MCSLESPSLGKAVRQQDTYNPNLLLALPRDSQRRILGVAGKLPFTGVDIWNAYELSWLDIKGMPQIALATFVFPCDTPNLIESRSFKLYLNSFSQTNYASAREVEGLTARDLSAACGSPVEVSLLPQQSGAVLHGELEGESLDSLEIDIREYLPHPDFLEAGGKEVHETLSSNLLKSNCPVTGQPDWASVQVRYLGPHIDRAGLLRYIVSYRRFAGFHEQVVERMFVDILKACRPRELSVYARYTRRGGLDINPFRTNFEALPPRNCRTARQ